ncbi:MAG: hypothetical protein Q7R52_00440 [archaeon]|nr:hypothetical protein [archaeon]
MIRRILDKRGSHIEMILSFVVFVTFLVFLYSIIAPSIKQQKDKDYLLEYLQDKITEKVVTDFDYYSLTIDPNAEYTEYDQFLLDMPKLPNSQGHYSIIIKNGYDELINLVWYIKAGDSDNNNWMINTHDRPTMRYFKIYYSSSLPLKSPQEITDKNGYKKLSSNDYYFEFIRREKLIYSSDISTKIKCTPDTSEYDTLKNEFNIPTGRDFSFKFDFGGITCNKDGLDNVKGINVYSEEIPVLYFDSNANINKGLLTVYVW